MSVSPTMPNLDSASLFFSVGEPSGDRHATALWEQLTRLAPNARARGFGGPRMQEAGCQLDYELTNLAVIGFVEVVPKLREFFRVADRASDIFRNERPDAVILVDFPGFNWHVAKRAKEFDIPVFYYLPPQLWAWGQWRIEKIRKYVDHVICNLPFEPDWYARRGIEVEYVGHPFFDDLETDKLDQTTVRSIRQHAGLNVAILPGSRTREVKQIWPMQLAAIRELASRYSNARFSVACLREDQKQHCCDAMSAQDRELPIDFYVDKTSEVIEAADCALMKSGSVSLEMMARGTPAVVVYHVTKALYSIARRLTDINSMTLPNMIAQRTVMPEFLAIGNNRSETIERCVASLDRLMGDEQERLHRRMELLQLKAQFGTPGASARAAQFIHTKLAQAYQTCGRTGDEPANQTRTQPTPTASLPARAAA